MKLVKIVISFLIGIAVLPMIIKGVNNISKVRESITFTYINDNVPDDLEVNLYLYLLENDRYKNINEVIINEESYTDIEEIEYNNNEAYIAIYHTGYAESINVSEDGTVWSDLAQTDDIITVVWSINNVLNPTTILLITLIPLIFSAGLLIYLNKGVSNREY